MILLIDNYDSFVFNLARYFQRLGQETLVVRNDAISAADAVGGRFEGIVLSPGPCDPDQAGICLDVVANAPENLPIFGVCLGHQTIGQHFGGRDHSTVIHAHKTIMNMIKKDVNLKLRIDQLINSLYV